MLKIEKTQDVVRAETATAMFEWDLQRGGQLTGCTLKTSTGTQTILKDRPAPNLTLDLGDRTVSLADVPVTATFEREDNGCFIFTTKAELDDTFTVEQRYDVFREGVVFCEFMIQVKEGKKVSVRNADMTFPLDVTGAPRMRGNYVSRDPYPKQDVTCVHILSDGEICMDRETSTDISHLLAIYGLDLGWAEYPSAAQ